VEGTFPCFTLPTAQVEGSSAKFSEMTHVVGRVR
jgi:hypothetical protein